MTSLPSPARPCCTAAGQAYLFVIEDGTRALERPVTVGALIDGRYVIPDGLNEGDQVVVRRSAKPAQRPAP